jgi:hypothetical protein
MLFRGLTADARVERTGARPSRAVVKTALNVEVITSTVVRLLGAVQSEKK